MLDKLFSVREVRLKKMDSRVRKIKVGEKAEKFSVVDSVKSFRKVEKAENGNLVRFERYMTCLFGVKQSCSSAVSFS